MRRHNTPETRRDLLESGSRLFTELGFAAVSTEAIVSSVGLTRGALYHHFEGKKGLFRALLEQIQDQLAADVRMRAASSARERGPVEALRAGFQTYLDFALRDDVRRILFVDGPAVLGWETWHEIDFKFAFGATRAALDVAMQSGEIDQAPLDEMTHVLLGAVTQAGLELGRSPDPQQARQQYGMVIDQLIDRMRA